MAAAGTPAPSRQALTRGRCSRIKVACSRLPNTAGEAHRVWPPYDCSAQRRIGSPLLLFRLLLASLLVALSIAFLRYGSDEQPPTDVQAEAAVVFTGDHGRIDAGIDLLRRGVVRRLLISGANPNAGLWEGAFVRQFGQGRPDLARWLDCCIDLGVLAETTLQNAAETRCWVERHAIAGDVILITSALHMPRAHAALARHLPRYSVITWPVPDEPTGDRLRRKTLEFLKGSLTSLALRAPRTWTAAWYGPFAHGCPPQRLQGFGSSGHSITTE